MKKKKFYNVETRLRRKEGADPNDPHAVVPIYTAEVN
jgi:hypothetical protein